MKKDSGRNVFNEIYQQENKVKELVGHVYLNEDVKNSYSEIQKQAQKLSFLNDPVYLDADSRNCFNVILFKTAFEVGQSTKFELLCQTLKPALG